MSCLLLWTCGCSSTPVAYLEPNDRRMPDGIAVDLQAVPPETQTSAQTSDGVVTLRPRLGLTQARATVRAYFEAIAQEDSGRLGLVLASDAVYSTTLGGSPQGAFAALIRRFQVADYTPLKDLPFWEESQVLEGDEAASYVATTNTSPRRGRQPRVQQAPDVVVLVTIVTRRTALTTLFGESVVLGLRAEGDSYRVSQILEDYTPPR